MEKKYFKCEGWDQYDTMHFGFYKCTLIAPLGPYQVGTTLEIVGMNYGEGTIEVWDTDASLEAPAWTGKMSLVIE